jgi:membrane fusion protein
MDTSTNDSPAVPSAAGALKTPLFRPAAQAAQQTQWAGTIVLARPVPMRVAATVAGLLAAAIALTLVFGEYTRKVRVTGQIVPDAGSIKVVAGQFGRIASRLVDEGAHVTAGQAMFELVAERASGGGGVDTRIASLLSTRQGELVQTRQLQIAELRQRADALGTRQRAIDAEIASRHQEIALQDIQIKSVRSKLKRYKTLARQGFMSPAQLGQVEDEVTAQLARRKAMESNVLGVERERLLVQEESEAINGKIKLIQSHAAQGLAAVAQEALEHEGRSGARVLAPVAGVVTALALEPGQSVQGGTTLATILPAGSALEARLFVPSRAVGFIEPGQQVLLRLSAFAYQKFGQVEGTVTRVERSPVSDASAGSEPVYRITVKLRKQAVMAYGRTQQFKAGMQLEADILQDRRRLIEWVIDPLISATTGRSG